jgi:hypothetical protein
MNDKPVKISVRLSLTAGPYGGQELAKVTLDLMHPELTAAAPWDRLDIAVRAQVDAAMVMLQEQLKNIDPLLGAEAAFPSEEVLDG